MFYNKRKSLSFFTLFLLVPFFLSVYPYTLPKSEKVKNGLNASAVNTVSTPEPIKSDLLETNPIETLQNDQSTIKLSNKDTNSAKIEISSKDDLNSISFSLIDKNSSDHSKPANATEVKKISDKEAIIKLDNSTTLEYELNENKVKETIEINDRNYFDDSLNLDFDFDLKNKYYIEGNKDGTLAIKDNDSSETAFIIEAPFIVDSNNNKGEAHYEIKDDKILSLLLDKKFVDTAIFPILVDPTVIINSSTTTIPNSYTKDRTLFQAGSGTFVKVYSNGSELVFETSADGGNTWSGATTLVTSSSVDDYGFSGWIDYDNNIHLVYSNNGSNDYIFYQELVYTSGSDSWASGGEHTVESGGTSQAYPSVCADSSGVIYASYRYYDGINYIIQVKSSDDDGATWSAATNISDGTNTNSNLYSSLLLWNGKPALIYNFQNLSIKYNYYNGSVWQSAGWANETITDEVDADTGQEFSVGETLENHHLHLTWRGSGSSGILYQENSNSVSGWDSSSTQITTDHNDRNPSLSMSSSNSLYLYYADYIAANSYDIKYKIKQDISEFSNNIEITSDGLNNLQPSAIQKSVVQSRNTINLAGSNQEVSLGKNIPIAGKSALTVGGWFRAEDYTNSMLASQWASGGSFMLAITSSTNIAFGLSTGTGTTTKNATFSMDSNWHQIFAVYDGSQMLVYVDGNAIGDPQAKTGTIASSAQNVIVGGFDNSDWYYTGNIGPVAIYDRALSAIEISALYSDDKFLHDIASDANLLAGYNFTEGTGSTTKDISVNNFNGSLINGASWSTIKQPFGATETHIKFLLFLI